ncbi:helix-turn-helix domain-containing protein [Streptomyces sp. CL12]|uniref:helix-turn-helix domain-containing protein n=1 Tax=Streptomyces sp. CL12 TaxID=3391744 RepID=UPI003A7F9AD0
MAESSRGVQCARCDAPIEKTGKGGRPRIYCTPRCRRLAQRERDRARLDPGPSWRPIAHDLVTNSLQLYGGQQMDLESIFVLAEHITRDTECLVAVAVDGAVRRGECWQDIAAAAGVSRASAVARWGGSRASDLLVERVPPPKILMEGGCFPASAVSAAQRVPRPRASGRAAGARKRLGVALRTLCKRSRVSLPEAAAVTGMSLGAITDMVEGRTVASWPETYTVAHVLRGEPEDLLHLWECASGERLPTGRSGTDRLAAALRGAWLVAGAPSLVIASDVDVAVARAALCGQIVPPWSVATTLLAGFGADPALFQPLWGAARAAQLESGDGTVLS